MKNDVICSLWLHTRKGISNHIKKALIDEYKTASTLYYMSTAEIDGIYADTSVKQALLNKNTDEACSVKRACDEKSIEIIAYEDDSYPKLLRDISSPPYILYKKGADIDLKNMKAAAVVGSRILSDYGKYVTAKISDDLCAQGFTIVSGMAAGADGEAHRAARNAGAPTVAVLGCGADIVYPMQNRDIYEYASKYGAVISEYPPSFSPTRSSFPARNRIIAGISAFTVVTEARLNSGSLITARDANSYGRRVFAVPQNINSPYGQGSNQLLKEYAHVITSGADAFEYYIREYGGREQAEQIRRNIRKRAEETIKEQNFSEDEKRIIKALKNGASHINKISDETGFPIGKAKALMSLLEIRGVVCSIAGNAYGLTEGLIK